MRIAFTLMSTDFVVVETSNNTLLLLHMLIFVVNILKVLAHTYISWQSNTFLTILIMKLCQGSTQMKQKKNVDLICDESKRDALNMLFCRLRLFNTDIIAQRALKPYLFKK